MSRTEGEHAGPAGSGTVVLELGPGAGALVLVTPPELDGAEIDVSMAGPEGYRTHSIVRRRLVTGGTQYAAVYPSLPPGTYYIWKSLGEPLTTAVITGGTVTMTDWTTGQ